VPTAKAKSNVFPYFNRELSWLAFNRRVLEQAESIDYPILERIKYLAFVSSNLDEFFETRVAGLMQQVKSGVLDTGPDGLGPTEQLRQIRRIVNRQLLDHGRCWAQQIVPQLEQSQILFCGYHQLTAHEQKWAAAYFEQKICSTLTPQIIDPADSFPLLSNKALYILATINDPKPSKSGQLLAIIQVPAVLPELVKIDAARHSKADVYVSISDIIQHHAQALFPDNTLTPAAPFRITRNSDLDIDEEAVENLLNKIEERLVRRQKGAAVRLQITHETDAFALTELLRATKLLPENVYTTDRMVSPLQLLAAYQMIDRADLKFPVQAAIIPREFENPGQIFSQIRRQDLMLHQPYDSFQSFVDFLDQAAQDPAVYTIKQTLYRTSGDSPIIAALKEASRRGKQVTVLVEIKARFDEANNIQWAKELEQIGVHVVYGLAGLKTHCKLCMIQRREGTKMRRYVHLGTGNYNPQTARFYTDLSYFTSKIEITEDVANLFNTLTGSLPTPVFKKLLVAPFTLHSQIQSLIHTETRNAAAGKNARIIIQVNSLVDSCTIDNLYRASQAGVKIELIVRGICNLVPNLKDVSENIRVRSILGRYLEHSRIFYFENSHSIAPLLFAGSADWMPRNFYRRIEVIFPVEDPQLKERLIDILESYLIDTQNTHLLSCNGSYQKKDPVLARHLVSAQERFSRDVIRRHEMHTCSHSDKNLMPADQS
jgi:polyphosphate kinase